MTYAPRVSEFAHYVGVAATPGRAVAQRPAPKAGFWRRAYDAVFRVRQTQAEREIARYLECTGGRLTDDIERRITERLTTGSWSR